MAIDISNKEEKQIALTGTQIEETLLQAHLSKDAIEKIEGLEASASEIDGVVSKEKDTLKYFGVIRQDTKSTAWYYIDDSSHKPYGFGNITNEAKSLALYFNGSPSRVGSFSIEADESFAARGIKFGASIGMSKISIYAYKEQVSTINMSNGTILQDDCLRQILVKNTTTGIHYITREAGESYPVLTPLESPNDNFIEIVAEDSTKIYFKILDSSGNIKLNPSIKIRYRDGYANIPMSLVAGGMANIWIYGEMWK